MYSQWQAAWRCALITGIALLAVALLQTWAVIQIGAPLLPVLGVTVLAVGAATPTMALGFRSGLHLAGLRSTGPSFVLVASAIQLAMLALLAMVPIESHPVELHLESTPGQTQRSALIFSMHPILAIVLPSFVLPLVVAVVVARVIRARASAA